ncbi:DUF294 nucleotidyltransferase-like domain-containing protein [Vibrio nitrifigilis]|uniref:Cyclic nucleotide-binding/CBS domain-containing protein n=1 Tax=Vibrio nitrifigilis TaxID=2789781 RepID=A0ABS0GFQ7_9VIBR|nr:DUF294 nucleotidyltransferase-like domain-containing protein [Vibrio nitrifigilis]MBF9001254.1 cyclic nucleotide-binding/CBS domain-containing protein [Vibrio nitrifigilis]
MPTKFDMQTPPFDHLTGVQQKRFRAALDIAYYRTGQIIIEAQQPAQYLHIVIKGTVEEQSAETGEVYAHYTHDDLFDVRGLFSTLTKHRYVALEDTLVYLLPKSVFADIYGNNADFANYFDTSLVARRALLEKAQRQKNIAEFILTKVDASIYHPPLLIAGSTSIRDTTLAMKQHEVDAALIPLNEQEPFPSYAIITQTNLLHALVSEKHSLYSPILPIASQPVISVEEGDYLFDAMVQMTRCKVKRLMVKRQGQAVGLLDMTQILSTFSTHSHVLTLAIARANDLESLIEASQKQRLLVESLFQRGVRTRFIMELLAAVNEQIMEKAFQLIVPQERQAQCCFIVLGSEGRKEQILKTDQDNALILAQDIDWPEVEQCMASLSTAMIQLGYPPCPGKVMVNNPEWIHSQNGWKEQIMSWCSQRSAHDLMHLAILADAHVVAGNHELITPLKTTIKQCTQQQDALLADMVKPALAFASPLTFFGQVKQGKKGLDIKQGGIFPIVHGVRTLSLEHGVEVTNTFERIETLQAQHILEKNTADNLSEALKFFIKLRLTQQLQHDHQTHLLSLEPLARAERDLLRHSLHVVKKFKQWLAYHYQVRE